MDWTLELVVVPASDLDRSKAFYLDQVGFDLVVDHSAGPDFRVVQLNPKGSTCGIAMMKVNNDMAPGTLHGLHLCVDDIVAAREELVGRGVDASEPFWFSETGQQPGLDPERRSYATFFTFKDPDANTWLVQEKHADNADAHA